MPPANRDWFHFHGFAKPNDDADRLSAGRRIVVRSSSDYRYRAMPAADAMAALRRQLSQGREHHYKAWLQDLHHARQRLPRPTESCHHSVG
jgi:hypothetical protein